MLGKQQLVILIVLLINGSILIGQDVDMQKKQIRPSEAYRGMFDGPINLQEKADKYYSGDRKPAPLIQEAADIEYTITGDALENYNLAKSKYGEFNPIEINPQSVLDARQTWYDKPEYIFAFAAGIMFIIILIILRKYTF